MIAIILFAALTAAQLAATPASEALIDRFMAVIPPSREAEERPSPEETAEQQHLVQLNPGKDEAIQAIFRDQRQCTDQASDEMAQQQLRKTAASLGNERLGRLIAFYAGPDYARYTAMMERERLGKTLDSDPADLEAMAAKYPLQAFFDATQTAARSMFTDPSVWERFGQCAEQRDRAIAAAELRTL